ncbi:MAG: LysR family transcriptional regulator [Mesorhizobium sp.]|uniref:LysR family transcriptional regulator n=1 Tax=Mesorhizobium sp. TaxID=1871066 RepID=UPI0012238A0B|nr:LysR family transcriptional regulator [Mesorhizobium sp.]TIN95499.1 MAG: LysR family transcriptional regulator [Mesorhizobium sp.]TJU97145.1 MAG: LysR family transcriptional regulator [Mesorhizobium sp.]
MAIELRHLRYAVAAAHYGSFRRAAEALGVKQSSLSRRIRQMEDRLGVAVFERSSSGVRLTDAGTEILRASRHLVEGLDRMTASAKAAGRGEAGRLAIGFYTSLSAGNLRASFLEHARRFPEVEIRTVEGVRASLFAGLEHGTLDVAIVTGEPAGREGGAMALWGERIMVALPESHPLAANETVYWTDLRGETFLLSRRDPGPEFRDILLAKLGSPGVQPILVSHDVSREDIMSLVGAGFGVSLICEAAIGASYAGAVYRDVQDGNGPSRISYAAYWQRSNDNPALVHFLKLLEERYPSLSPRTAEPAAPSRTPDPSP